MTDIVDPRPGAGSTQNTGAVRYHDEADGSYSMAEASHLRAWDTTDLAWNRVKADHATGGIVTSGGGGGGGAATIADGADVAQGTTTDLSSANTVVGILKAIKAAITGTLTTTTSWVSAQHVIVDSAPSTAVTGPLTDTQLRATPVPVSGTVTATTGGLTDTQLRATPVPVSGTVTATTGGLTDTQLRATAVPVSLASTVVTGTVTATDAAARSLDGVTQNAVVDVDARRLLEQVLLELKFQTAMLAALAPSALPHDAQLLT